MDLFLDFRTFIAIKLNKGITDFLIIIFCTFDSEMPDKDKTV
jgi:hypothetical protein